MKTLLWLDGKMIAEFNDAEVYLEVFDTVNKLEINGQINEKSYKVTDIIYDINIWNKKADLTENIYLK